MKTTLVLPTNQLCFNQNNFRVNKVVAVFIVTGHLTNSHVVIIKKKKKKKKKKKIVSIVK